MLREWKYYNHVPIYKARINKDTKHSERALYPCVLYLLQTYLISDIQSLNTNFFI